MKLLYLVISVILGAIIWFFGGWLISITCLNLPEQLQNSETLVWFLAAKKVAFFWSFMGGFLGLITSLVFLTRPKNDHFTSVTDMPMRSAPSGFNIKPVSMAQVYSAITAVFLSLLLGVLGAIYFLPSLEVVVIASLPTRIFMAAFTSFASVYPISYYPLEVVLKFKERRL